MILGKRNKSPMWFNVWVQGQTPVFSTWFKTVQGESYLITKLINNNHYNFMMFL